MALRQPRPTDQEAGGSNPPGRILPDQWPQQNRFIRTRHDRSSPTSSPLRLLPPADSSHRPTLETSGHGLVEEMPGTLRDQMRMAPGTLLHGVPARS
jgi:hypothetical protein